MSAKKRAKRRRAKRPRPAGVVAPRPVSSAAGQQPLEPATKAPLLAPALVFAVALGLRLLYLLTAGDTPSFELPIVDSEVYDRAARGLVEGRGFTDGFFYQPFFYPFFLAVVYTLAGPSVIVAKVVQAVIGALTCVAVTELGTRLLDRRAGLLAGAITALYGPLIFFDGELLATGWAALWSVVVVWLLTIVQSSHSRGLYFGLGVVAALAVLTRPTFMPYLAIAGVWMAVTELRRDRATALRSLATAVVGFLLVVLPVAGLCADVTGRFRFLPASGSLNLHLGNNPEPCETLTIRPGQDWHELVSTPRREGHDGIWGAQDYFAGLVRGYIMGQPAAFVAGVATKAVQLGSSREIPRNVDIYLYRQWSSLLRVTVWKAGDFGFPFGLLLPLVVVGVVARWRQLRWPLLLYLVLYPAAVAVVFVSARYRVPMVPVLAIPAAAGAIALWQQSTAHRWRPLLVSGAVIVATLAVAVVPGPWCQEQDLEDEYWFMVAAAHLRDGDKERAISCLRRAVSLDPEYYEAGYQLGSMLLERGELDEAADNLQRAVSARPDSSIAHRELGMALGRSGRFDAALPHLRRAIELAPDDARAHNNLGVLLAQMGDHQGAVVHLERAVALDPDYPAAQQNLAWVHEQLDRR